MTRYAYADGNRRSKRDRTSLYDAWSDVPCDVQAPDCHGVVPEGGPVLVRYTLSGAYAECASCALTLAEDEDEPW